MTEKNQVPTAYARAWVQEKLSDRAYQDELHRAWHDGGFDLLTRLAPALRSELTGWTVDVRKPLTSDGVARLVLHSPGLPSGVACVIEYDPHQTHWQHRMFHAPNAAVQLAAYAAGWMVTVGESGVWWKAIEAALPVDEKSCWVYLTKENTWAMQRDQGRTTLVLHAPYIFRGVIGLSVAEGRWVNPGKHPPSFTAELRVGPTSDPSEALARVCSELRRVERDLVVLGSAFSPRIELGAAFTSMIAVRDFARTMVPHELRVGCVFENLGMPKFNIFRDGVHPSSITCDAGDGQKGLLDLLNEAAPVIQAEVERMMSAEPVKE